MVSRAANRNPAQNGSERSWRSDPRGERPLAFARLFGVDGLKFRHENDALLLVRIGARDNGDARLGSGSVFGQGVLCAGGSLKRLFVHTAASGVVSAPSGADLPVSQRSSALGDPIAPGYWRYYQVYYRDPTVLGACPATSTFNSTQALALHWTL